MGCTHTGQTINFPKYTGVRCLMMPYIQGDPISVPEIYADYWDIIESIVVVRGDIGYLTIDESPVHAGQPHRGARALHGRALHTEAGRDPQRSYGWGGAGWGRTHRVTLDADVSILLANNVEESCAIWDATHENTSLDGDIGYAAASYPYEDAIFMKPGEVHAIGILTPHESLPVRADCNRQFLRIVSAGVHGREDYFTRNPLI